MVAHCTNFLATSIFFSRQNSLSQYLGEILGLGMSVKLLIINNQ